MGITTQVYACISEGDFTKATRILETKLADFPRSRPLLSLVAYCCYHNGEFARAAEFYERCCETCPESEEYQIYYVQSLVKGGSYLDASRVAAGSTSQFKSPRSRSRMKLLQAHAEFGTNALSACATTLQEFEQDDPATIIALATLDFREGRFAKALETYKIALLMGDKPMVRYCIALCHYRMGDYDSSLAIVNKLIEEQREEHIEGDESWQEYHSDKYFLTEALNLKAAVLYSTKQIDAARDTTAKLCDLQQNENLDTITIHNDAILNIEEDPAIGIQKLEFLLADGPPETLSNLLAFYISHGQGELAAETFTTNRQLAQEQLLPEVYAYFDAVVMSLTCPDDAFSVLETQISHYAAKLKAGKAEMIEATQLASARPTTSKRRTNTLDVAAKELAATLDEYVPMLMLQARLCWDRKEYAGAEQILGRGVDFCRDRDAWRMNMGHVMFAQQEEKFDDAIEHYEFLLKHHADSNLLKVPAVALANLCVAYIMTNQNEAAEELIKTIEREENQQVALGNCERTHHTCIVNLVVGTLYCERGNFEFGVGRICKSMGASKQDLCPDTWFYTKRCFLALAGKISKVMCTLNDDTLREILSFFDDIEDNGKHIVTENADEAALSDPLNPNEPVTIASESRQLKDMFTKICT